MLRRKGGIISIYVFAVDCLVMAAAYFAALSLYRLVFGHFSENGTTAMMIHLIAFVIMELIVSSERGFVRRKVTDEILICVRNTVLFSAVLALLIFVVHAVDDVSRMVSFFTVSLYFVLDFIVRCILRKLLVRRAGTTSDRILLCCDRESAEHWIREFNEIKDSYRRVTAVAIPEGVTEEKIEGVPVVSGMDSMFDFARREIVDEVVLSLTDVSDETLREYIDEFESMGIVVSVVLRNMDLSDKYYMSTSMTGGFPTVSFARTRQNQNGLILKRVFDIFAGLVGSLITIILFLVLGPIIKLDSKGPVFFRQRRVGRNGRFFTMYKFRSMCEDAESRKKDFEEQNELQGQMFKLSNDPRVTRVGRFLRASSLDEFPQFFNILRGDMSLIGTRPPTIEEFRAYEEHHKRRLSMKPGLTGLWQVSGRSEILNFEDVVRLDCQYIDNWSLELDFRILLKTIVVVLKGKGAK